MSHFCTMCEEYYNDPTKHRYIECMYYNGCACGIKNPGREHFKQCFLLRERKRKASTSPAPMLSNSTETSKLDEITCSMCLVKYRGNPYDHRTVYCAYYNGCPVCGKKYFSPPGHMAECEERKRLLDAGFEDDTADIKYKCSTCNEYIAAMKYDTHKSSCKKEEEEAAADDDTKVFTPVIPQEPKEKCEFCGVSIVEKYINEHRKNCFESLERKFSYSVKYHGEPEVIDVRVKKGERAVRFSEGGGS